MAEPTGSGRGEQIGNIGPMLGLSSTNSWRSNSMREDRDDEYELQWAAIERLSTSKRARMSVVDDGEENKRVVDVTKLGASEKRVLMEKLITHIENDNLLLS